MATQAIKVTLGVTQGIDGRFNAQGSTTSQPANASTAATEAAVAVLEADGVSPTQAHVTALRAAWDAYVTAAGLLTAAPTGNFVVLYNDAVITDGNRFASAVREALNVVRSRGLSIP